MSGFLPSLGRVAALARGVLGFKAVWLCAVLGAANGAAWLGPLALLAFAGLQILCSANRRREALVLAAGLAMGVALETVLAKTGWVDYAPGWPAPALAPAWIVALWGGFSLMSIDGLAWLRGRRFMAALLGAAGGPFAYYAGISLGAGAGATTAFYVALGLFYAAATPLLVELGKSLEGGEAAPGRRK